jgi:hypothetical protein
VASIRNGLFRNGRFCDWRLCHGRWRHGLLVIVIVIVKVSGPGAMRKHRTRNPGNSKRGFDFNRPLLRYGPCPTGKSLLLREFLSSPPGKNKSLRDLVEADLLTPYPASMKRGVTADRHET